jgi:putative membrane protein
MKNLAKVFLSPEEQERIVRAVKQAETVTSGEIVPMVVSSSYHYPLSNMIGALAGSLALALAATAVVTNLRSWGGPELFDLWIFPAVFAVCFVLLYLLVRNVPFLKRVFITRGEIAEEVEEAALTSFYRQGLNNTRDKTGILIFISVFERQVRVLADQGINDRVESGVWQELVDTIVQGIKARRQAEAICAAVARCGELLQKHFPIKPDDSDELSNLIIES